MLRDKRLWPEYEKRIDQLANGDNRPAIEGNSRQVQQLHGVHVTLTQLLRVTARNFSIPLPKAPKYPGEAIAEQKAAEKMAELDAEILESMNVEGVHAG